MTNTAIIKDVGLDMYDVWCESLGIRRPDGCKYYIEQFRAYLKNPQLNADKFRKLLKAQKTTFIENRTEKATVFYY